MDFKNTTLAPLTNNVPTIREFFANQSVFITGATGFMGKVLVEKLLRTCPEIKAIYLLIRCKKGLTNQMRLDKMFNIPLFDKLRNKYPESFSKVKIMKGDISLLNYGLSETDIEFLKNEINVVFYVAASVRFDDSLRDAIFINTRGTREMINIMKGMKKLKVFLYTSTTYSNFDKEVIEEKVYKSPVHWKTMIRAAEEMDDELLRILEKKILDKFPNTYTFTKNLTEELVKEECKNIPSVIYRPTVVISSFKNPIPGWVDNFNGPMGLVVAVLTGLLHIIYMKPEKYLDWLPVDVATNSIISSAWYKAVEKTHSNKCLVINSSTRDYIPVRNTTLVNFGLSEGNHRPNGQILWYPFCLYTPNKYLYWCYFMFFQVIPASLLNILIKLNKHKLRLFEFNRRVYTTNMCLAPFMHNEWEFRNQNFKSLQGVLKPEDQEEFTVNYSNIDTEELFRVSIEGTRKYLLKEKETTKGDMEKRVFKLKGLYILHVLSMGFLLISMALLINSFTQISFDYNSYI